MHITEQEMENPTMWELYEENRRLKHLREIAIDIEACLRSGVPVPEFMELAFSDAITSTGEVPEKEAEDG